VEDIERDAVLGGGNTVYWDGFSREWYLPVDYGQGRYGISVRGCVADDVGCFRHTFTTTTTASSLAGN